MKRFFLLACVALFAACSDENPSETPAAPHPPTPPSLTVTLSGITATSAKMTVVPSSDEVCYLNNIISEEIFVEHHRSDVAVFVKNLLSDSGFWGAKTVGEIVLEISKRGTSVYRPEPLTPATGYVAFAVGIAGDGSLTTEPVIERFTTKNAPSE